MAMLVYAGESEAGERALAPFRALAKPLADMVRPMSYPEIYPPEEGGGDYHPVAAARTMFVDPSIAPWLRRSSTTSRLRPASMAVAQLRVLGGAMARVPADATAFAHRNSKIMVNVAALYEKPDEKATHEAWVTRLCGSIATRRQRRVCQLPRRRGRGAHPRRVSGPDLGPAPAIKARYDPTNLFRLNQNIPPAGK